MSEVEIELMLMSRYRVYPVALRYTGEVTEGPNAGFSEFYGVNPYDEEACCCGITVLEEDSLLEGPLEMVPGTVLPGEEILFYYQEVDNGY